MCNDIAWAYIRWRGETYFGGISEFCLFTRAGGMSENREGPKNNLLM